MEAKLYHAHWRNILSVCCRLSLLLHTGFYSSQQNHISGVMWLNTHLGQNEWHGRIHAFSQPHHTIRRQIARFHASKICVLSSEIVLQFGKLLSTSSQPKVTAIYHQITNFAAWARFYLHGLTLIPAWINNYTHYNVWDEINYLFLNFNGATVEV